MHTHAPLTFEYSRINSPSFQVLNLIVKHNIILIRGKPERAPNTREIGSGLYVYVYIYRIVGNFRGGLIFVIFVTALIVTKFTPHENLP